MKEKKVCSFCNKRKIYAQELCKNCYSRKKRNGTPIYLREKRSKERAKLLGTVSNGFILMEYDKFSEKPSPIAFQCLSCGKTYKATSIEFFYNSPTCRCKKYPLEYLDLSANSARSTEIYNEAHRGMTLQEIANKHNICKQRVSQILCNIKRNAIINEVTKTINNN